MILKHSLNLLIFFLLFFLPVVTIAKNLTKNGYYEHNDHASDDELVLLSDDNILALYQNNNAYYVRLFDKTDGWKDPLEVFPKIDVAHVFRLTNSVTLDSGETLFGSELIFEDSPMDNIELAKLLIYSPKNSQINIVEDGDDISYVYNFGDKALFVIDGQYYSWSGQAGLAEVTTNIDGLLNISTVHNANYLANVVLEEKECDGKCVSGNVTVRIWDNDNLSLITEQTLSILPSLDSNETRYYDAAWSYVKFSDFVGDSFVSVISFVDEDEESPVIQDRKKLLIDWSLQDGFTKKVINGSDQERFFKANNTVQAIVGSKIYQWTKKDSWSEVFERQGGSPILPEQSLQEDFHYFGEHDIGANDFRVYSWSNAEGWKLHSGTKVKCPKSCGSRLDISKKGKILLTWNPDSNLFAKVYDPKNLQWDKKHQLNLGNGQVRTRIYDEKLRVNITSGGHFVIGWIEEDDDSFSSHWTPTGLWNQTKVLSEGENIAGIFTHRNNVIMLYAQNNKYLTVARSRNKGEAENTIIDYSYDRVIDWTQNSWNFFIMYQRGGSLIVKQFYK